MILFISMRDYSNVGYGFANALKSIGVEAKAVSHTRRKTREIDEQGERVTVNQTCALLKGPVDWVVFMHSSFPWVGKLKPLLKGKKVAVFHGGTKYRTNVAGMNAFWNPIVDLSLVQMPSIMGLGAKDEHWMIPAVDTERITPVHVDNSVLCVGHFPTGASKGSKEIWSSVKAAKKHGVGIKYTTSLGILTWENHLKRMAECDVIVDKVQQNYNGMMTGEWAVTTLEAAALGKVPVVTFNSEARYKKVYGEHGIERVDNQEMLTDKLVELAKGGPGMIRRKQQEARNWVERNHSLQATGKRLKEILR